MINGPETSFDRRQVMVADHARAVARPPDYLSTSEGLDANFNLAEKREVTRRKALDMRGLYPPVDSLGVSLEEAFGLALDQGYFGALHGRSGVILDGLIQVEKGIWQEKLMQADPRSREGLVLKDGIVTIDAYLSAPEEERRTRESVDSVSRLDSNGYNIGPITRYVQDYLVPLNSWMPEVPITVVEKGKPQRLMEDIEAALDNGAYPLGSKDEVHKTYFDHDSVVTAPNRMLKEGIEVDSETGLISYPQHDASISRWTLQEFYDIYARYVADMANGREISARDAYYLANFGTMALVFGESLSREESVSYYKAAQDAFRLSLKLGKARLTPDDYSQLEKSLEKRDEDIPWPYIFDEQGRSEGLLDVKAEIMSEIRANGGWVNAHLHLDRSDTITPASFTQIDAPLQAKWDLVDGVKEAATVGQIYGRMARNLESLMAQGVQAISTFIDVDPVIGDKSIRAAQRLRDTYGDQIQIRFINQALKGVLDPDAQKWFLQGAEFADIVGGLPGRDKGREEEHIDLVVETAKRLGKMAHVHVDQFNKPGERETEMLARSAIRHGMRGRVVGIHGVSIAAQPREYREELYALMREADLTLVVCPKAWLDSPRSDEMAPTHNSIAPVDELVEAGVTVALGSDNIRDLYLPTNTANMWEELDALSVTTRFRNIRELARIGSVNGLKALGIDSPTSK